MARDVRVGREILPIPDQPRSRSVFISTMTEAEWDAAPARIQHYASVNGT